MNRKGFTLIELLAVIVILGLVLVFTVPNITDAYKNSKLKTEEIFVDRLSDSIEGYISLNTTTGGLNFSNTPIKIKKENPTNPTFNSSNTYIEMIAYKANVKIEDIINSGIITSNDYINPGNKDVSCDPKAQVEVYRDEDFVYCHKVELDALTCLTDAFKNAFKKENNCSESSEDSSKCYIINTCSWEEVKES
ncbi:MAG: type II secretion system protein [Bacilli bacterium]